MENNNSKQFATIRNKMQNSFNSEAIQNKPKSAEMK